MTLPDVEKWVEFSKLKETGVDWQGQVLTLTELWVERLYSPAVVCSGYCMESPVMSRIDTSIGVKGKQPVTRA